MIFLKNSNIEIPNTGGFKIILESNDFYLTVNTTWVHDL